MKNNQSPPSSYSKKLSPEEWNELQQNMRHDKQRPPRQGRHRRERERMHSSLHPNDNASSVPMSSSQSDCQYQGTNDHDNNGMGMARRPIASSASLSRSCSSSFSSTSSSSVVSLSSSLASCSSQRVSNGYTNGVGSMSGMEPRTLSSHPAARSSRKQKRGLYHQQRQRQRQRSREFGERKGSKPSKSKSQKVWNHDNLSVVTGQTGSITQDMSTDASMALSTATTEMMIHRSSSSSRRDNKHTLVQRQGQDARSSSYSHSLRKQKLYHRQMQLLLSTTGASIVLFLFFFLNIFAFLSVLLGVSSLSMLGYTAYSYLLFLYREAHDGVLFTLLPSSLQDYLLHTSPHGAMTGGGNFLQDRWYLLYLVPGLTPQQMDSIVARLPSRQREMAYGRGGLARLILPENMYRLIAPPVTAAVGSDRIGENVQGSDSSWRNSVEMVGGGGGQSGYVVRRIMDGGTAVPLPVIEEGDDSDCVGGGGADEEDEEENEPEVTMQEALREVLSDARMLWTGRNDHVETVLLEGEDAQSSQSPQLQSQSQAQAQPIQSQSQSQSQSLEFHDLSWDTNDPDDLHGARVEVHVVHHQDSDSETSDLGLDISTDDLTGGMNESQLSRLGRFLRLRPAPVAHSAANVPPVDSTAPTAAPHRNARPSRPPEDLPPRIIMAGPEPETERPVEVAERVPRAQTTVPQHPELSGEDVIQEAISTMVDNYTTSARNAVTDAITNAGVSLVENVTPPLIRAGTWLSSFSSVGLLGLFTASPHPPLQILGGRAMGGGGRRLEQGRTERYLLTGLMSTLAMGALTVGGSYVTRFLTRRYVANQRKLLDNNGVEDDWKGKTKNSI